MREEIVLPSVAKDQAVDRERSRQSLEADLVLGKRQGRDMAFDERAVLAFVDPEGNDAAGLLLCSTW